MINYVLNDKDIPNVLSWKLRKEIIESKYSKMDQVKFFKGCLPQILLGPFLKTLSQLLHT